MTHPNDPRTLPGRTAPVVMRPLARGVVLALLAATLTMAGCGTTPLKDGPDAPEPPPDVSATGFGAALTPELAERGRAEQQALAAGVPGAEAVRAQPKAAPEETGRAAWFKRYFPNRKDSGAVEVKPVPDSGSDVAESERAKEPERTKEAERAKEPERTKESDRAESAPVRAAEPAETPASEPPPVAVVDGVAPLESLSELDRKDSGFAGLMGGFNGLVVHCEIPAGIRDAARQAFRATYGVHDEGLAGGTSGSVESRLSADSAPGQTFARTSAAMSGVRSTDCDYVRGQATMWIGLAEDMRQMSKRSAEQYRKGLVAELRRASGLTR